MVAILARRVCGRVPVDSCGVVDNDASEIAPDGGSDIFAKVSETRQKLARTAESVAQTVEYSADVHADMARTRPEAHEHAERNRRLAAAERASAAALRHGELPSDADRRVIRAGGGAVGEQGDPGASAGASAPPPNSTGPTDPDDTTPIPRP